MKRKKLIVIVGLVFAGAVARAAFSQAADALDPLRVAADSHKLVLDNPFVRVLDVHVPAGKTERSASRASSSGRRRPSTWDTRWRTWL